MSTYGNAASIFQLAFGLNAALPTVYFAYRRAHDSLARHLAEEMSRIDPSLEFGERELIVVRHYVRYGFPAMRNTRPLGLIIAGLFGVAVSLSLIGLVLSAVDPTAPLDNWTVVLFSVFALVFCPVAGILYNLLMSYSEKQILIRLDKSSILGFIDPIKKSLTMEELRREMKNMRREIQDYAFRMQQDEFSMAWRDFKIDLRKRFENVRRVFRR
ncbi:hypothetical protein [Methylocapsa aurea]|uniref:hypothetical protein n=1 Tax=Methylocapsa aurea TaxID=663610 RepID=UPI0012EB400F|nr:hypothetical protein [Methylocapsa aurea]